MHFISFSIVNIIHIADSDSHRYWQDIIVIDDRIANNRFVIIFIV